MYILDDNERKTNLASLVMILWSDDVNFLFDNRRIIRNDANTSLSECELFRWMKNTDEEKYSRYKQHISDTLGKIAESGKLTEDEIKSYLAYELSKYLSNEFIKL